MQLVIQAGAVGRGGEALVLDMGEPVLIDEVARRLAAQATRPVEVVYVGLRPGEKLHETLLGQGERDDRPSHPQISQVPVPPLAYPAVEVLCHPGLDDAELMAELRELSGIEAPTALRSRGGPAGDRRARPTLERRGRRRPRRRHLAPRLPTWPIAHRRLPRWRRRAATPARAVAVQGTRAGRRRTPAGHPRRRRRPRAGRVRGRLPAPPQGPPGGRPGSPRRDHPPPGRTPGSGPGLGAAPPSTWWSEGGFDVVHAHSPVPAASARAGHPVDARRPASRVRLHRAQPLALPQPGHPRRQRGHVRPQRRHHRRVRRGPRLAGRALPLRHLGHRARHRSGRRPCPAPPSATRYAPSSASSPTRCWPSPWPTSGRPRATRTCWPRPTR